MNATGIVKAYAAANTAANSLAAGRIYPLIAPQGATMPFAVVSLVAIEPNDTKTGAATEDTATVQIDCYAPTFLGADALADALRRAMDKNPQTLTVGTASVRVDGVQFVTERQSWEDDTEVFRISQDFRLRVSRSTSTATGIGVWVIGSTFTIA